MKEYLPIFASISIAASCCHADNGVTEDGEMLEFKRRLDAYSHFCPVLSKALTEGDAGRLIELADPSFKSVISNEVVNFGVRLNGLKGSSVYCKVMPCKEMYSREMCDVINSLICDDIVDIMPIAVWSLRSSGGEVPITDVLYVHTVLRKDNTIGIVGRVTLGPFLTTADVGKEIGALKKRETATVDPCALYRDNHMKISDGEAGWRLARELKECLSSTNMLDRLVEMIPDGCNKERDAKELKGLSRYRISGVVPSCSDSRFFWNSPTELGEALRVYVLSVYAEDCLVREIGRVIVAVSRDGVYKIIDVIDAGPFWGVATD